MVNIPNTNLLTIGAIAIGAFFLVREIRGAGQDLSTSITKGVLAGTGQTIQAGVNATGQQIQSGFTGLGKSLTGIFSGIGQPKPQLDLTGIPTKKEVAIVRELERTTVDPNTDLSKFNPKGIFGFGFLGVDKKGISISLAKQLGLSGLSSGDINRQQLFQLSRIGQNIQSTSFIFDLFGRRDDIVFARTFGLDIPPRDQPLTMRNPPRDQPLPNTITRTNIQLRREKRIAVPLAGSGGSGQFVGGSIGLTPISRLSLSQIINRLGVTASKASSLRRRARAGENLTGFIPAGFTFNNNSGGL